MLDPHVATIEGWLAEELQLTALAIVGRLSCVDPQFGRKQHSIVQRLLKKLRRKTAERVMAEMALTSCPPARGRGRRCV